MIISDLDKSAIALVPHRVLNLDGEAIAVLSEGSNAWAVLDQKSYDNLLYKFDHKLYPEKLVNRLYDAGLVSINRETAEHSSRKKLGVPKSLLLKLTGACNIFCEYCYDYDIQRWKSNLTIERIKDAVNFLFKTNTEIGIVFHGGEPLIRFDTIKETVNYVESLRKHTDTKVRYSIQTNGALLTDEIVDFLSTNRFSVGLSIDGSSESSNRLRVSKSSKSALNSFQDVITKFPHFVEKFCGVLAVVSKANVRELPDFALWLQSKGINSLGLSFMDQAGKGKFVSSEKVDYVEAVGLFDNLCKLIEAGTIKELNVSAITSRVGNLYQYHSKDFCHKGPCAAADEFLVLDAEGSYRTCDSTYHPFFEIGENPEGEKNEHARNNIIQRYAWLKSESLTCSKCPLISVCGGTCAAKAIAANNNPYSIDVIECAISKFLYPKLLNEFNDLGKGPLYSYYEKHL